MLAIEICKFLAKYLFLLAMVMLLPLGFAAYCEFFMDPSLHPQPHSTGAFGAAVAISLAMAGLLRLFGRKASGQIHRRRDGILLVVMIWIVTSLVSALPFALS